MIPSYRLLVVDDEPRMCQIFKLSATKWGYQVQTASNGAEALRIIDEFQPEIVVSDIRMPQMDGEALLRALRERLPDAKVILMTAYGSVKGAVEAMRAGAFDYILKPFDNEELRVTLQRTSDFLRLSTDNAQMRKELGRRFSGDVIVGSSPQSQRVLEMIERVAPARATVLVTGESGTGKELVARAIHYRSPRASAPFLAINCAALSETLLESELFGHEKGAFTGAMRQHRGRFEEANGRTLFLDEIGEISLNFQAKLLRVLQEGAFERVGGTQTIKVDTRVVAATNRDLEEQVRKGLFRQDLYYRLNVVPIHISPLRERRSEIPELANHFLRRFAGQTPGVAKRLSEEALEALVRAEWRGNVRELENAVERAVILSRGTLVGVEDLWLTPSMAVSAEEARGISAASAREQLARITETELELPLGEFLDQMTKRRVVAALDACGWRKQDAAETLGVDRATLYRMIKKFGIEQD